MDYEIFLEAVNEHGVGDGSPRLIFRTQSQVSTYIQVAFSMITSDLVSLHF